MLRCREVARLCASDEIRSAPWRTRVAYRMHLMMCRHCRRYVRELARIAAVARTMAPYAVADPIDAEDRGESLIRGVLRDVRDPPDSDPEGLE